MPSNLDRGSLYRSTFVGREAELHQLQATFDAAVGGHGSVIAIPGEPGIGKTALCEQMAGHAAARGARTLVGRCSGVNSLNLPYLPIVEALRSYVLDVDVDTLRGQLGNAASDVARMIPDIGARLTVPEAAGRATDPEISNGACFNQ